MSDTELQEKQNGKKVPGKKQMLVLWTAVLTALGSTGIPKVIEMLETKPSTEQVQVMIAKQTEALTDELNDVIDTLKAVEKSLDRAEPERGILRTAVTKMETRAEMVQDILHTCCTRSVDRVENTPTVVREYSDEEELFDAGAPPAVMMVRDVFSKKEDKPFSRLKKLPRFDQVQLQGE